MSECTVKLPDVGEGIAEAEIVAWHVGIGERIEEDDVIVEVMTDKATVELPSPVSGVVRRLGGSAGDIIAVGATLITIETGSTPIPTATPVPTVTVTPTATPPVTVVPSTDRPSTNGPTAAPAVRARALELGIDLAAVSGTGIDGRVVHADLDALMARRETVSSPRPAPAIDEIESVKITGLRRNIAERMQAAKRRIPHFTYVEEIDVTEIEALRARLNDDRADGQPKLSMLHFLMRAVVLAVGDHPAMNARFDDENGVVNRYRAVHLGIAVQTERGLMVTVVKSAERRNLWEGATEVIRLADAARRSRITLEELTGSTITITSLGALGGIVSTPVINAPEVAIIGVNKIVERAVFVDGVLVPRLIMNLSSSFDHRVVDGADAAAFIQTIKRLLETPALIFVPKFEGPGA